MVRGRQLDPTLRARIFELRAAGYGAKKIHKLLPDIPFNTIKTTLRRSKTSTPVANNRLHADARTDDSPSPIPAIEPHRTIDPAATTLSNSLGGPSSLTNRGGIPPQAQPPPQAAPTSQSQHQQQAQQQQQQQQAQQQQQQQQQQQHQKQQRAAAVTAAAASKDPQSRARARDLLNEFLPPPSSSTPQPGARSLGASTAALDLERLKAEYRVMPESQRAAADTELDLRKAALVSVRWEARKELEAARRQAQLEKLQALQNERLDPETFYARFQELVASSGLHPGVPPPPP